MDKKYFVKIYDTTNEGEQVAGWNVKDFKELKYYVKCWFLKTERLFCIMINKETGAKKYFPFNQC